MQFSMHTSVLHFPPGMGRELKNYTQNPSPHLCFGIMFYSFFANNSQCWICLFLITTVYQASTSYSCAIIPKCHLWVIVTPPCESNIRIVFSQCIVLSVNVNICNLALLPHCLVKWSPVALCSQSSSFPSWMMAQELCFTVLSFLWMQHQYDPSAVVFCLVISLLWALSVPAL